MTSKAWLTISAVGWGVFACGWCNAAGLVLRCWSSIGAPGPRGLPRLCFVTACCLSSCRSSCQGRQLPEKGRWPCRALTRARQRLYREGSGLVAGWSGQSLGTDKWNTGRAVGPANYAWRRYDRAWKDSADLPCNDQPWLITTPWLATYKCSDILKC